MESERIFYFVLQKKFQMEHNIALYSSADQIAPELKLMEKLVLIRLKLMEKLVLIRLKLWRWFGKPCRP
jgi:hypothetical protein